MPISHKGTPRYHVPEARSMWLYSQHFSYMLSPCISHWNVIFRRASALTCFLNPRADARSHLLLMLTARACPVASVMSSSLPPYRPKCCLSESFFQVGDTSNAFHCLASSSSNADWGKAAKKFNYNKVRWFWHLLLCSQQQNLLKEAQTERYNIST